jgi:hypothetical protein
MVSDKALTNNRKTLQNLVDNGPESPTHIEERIRARAYEIHDQRGREFGTAWMTGSSGDRLGVKISLRSSHLANPLLF